MSQKSKINSQWYRVTHFNDGEEKLLTTNVEGETRSAVLQSTFYDKAGNTLLIVVQLKMDNIPPAIIKEMYETLTAQNITPCLMIPPVIELLKLEPMTDVEVRRYKNKEKKAKENEN